MDPIPDPILPGKFLAYSRELNLGPLGWQLDVLTTIPNRQSWQIYKKEFMLLSHHRCFITHGSRLNTGWIFPVSLMEAMLRLMEYKVQKIPVFFYSLLFRDASTSLVISRLGSLGVYQKAVYYYCCVVNVSFVKFTNFNFMIYEIDE